MMACFREDYLALLDERVARITALVMTAQVEPAMVAALSLESSSAMVGARDLAAAVHRLRDALGTGVVLDPLTAELAVEAEAARRALTSS